MGQRQSTPTQYSQRHQRLQVAACWKGQSPAPNQACVEKRRGAMWLARSCHTVGLALNAHGSCSIRYLHKGRNRWLVEGRKCIAIQLFHHDSKRPSASSNDKTGQQQNIVNEIVRDDRHPTSRFKQLNRLVARLGKGVSIHANITKRPPITTQKVSSNDSKNAIAFVVLLLSRWVEPRDRNTKYPSNGTDNLRWQHHEASETYRPKRRGNGSIIRPGHSRSTARRNFVRTKPKCADSTCHRHSQNVLKKKKESCWKASHAMVLIAAFLAKQHDNNNMGSP